MQLKVVDCNKEQFKNSLKPFVLDRI